MKEIENLRKVRVRDYGKPIHDWEFIYDPMATSEQLKKRTAHCEIATCPDMEYTFDVEFNGNIYNLWSDGDETLILVCMLCIKLNDSELQDILAVRHNDNNKCKN